MKYDILIIGSGFGGLMCGAILSKNGYNVCVLEKNPRIGGCLQSYRRDGATFDTGLHYIGCMNEGQTLYRIFDYLGILPELKLVQLEKDGFEHITFAGDDNVYRYAQGHENFVEKLVEKFPKERKGIETYHEKLQQACDKFALYNLENGSLDTKIDIMGLGAYDEIAACTSNKKLQSVLAATNLLYAGEKDKTPFYIHAMIINSYIESAWRLVGGGNQLAEALAQVIRRNGGELFTSMQVNELIEEGGLIKTVRTTNGEVFTADNVISAIHPTTTIEMTRTNVFRKVFYNRFLNFKQTYPPFIINVKLKNNHPEWSHYNHYHYASDDVWAYNYPGTFVMFPVVEEEGCRAVSIVTRFSFDEVKKWEDTFNTYFTKGNRGADYEAFKEEKAEQLLSLVETRYPGFKSEIEKMHIITPLSYRDHTGIIEGSLYGIRKNYHEPMQTLITHQSKIPNLLFTGQNLNIHGILGVAISALMTCSSLLDLETLLKEIKR